MKLRDNQILPVQLGVEYFEEENPVPSIIVAPTAFGKSIVIAKIAKQVNEKILVIQPSKELLEQNYEKFTRLGGEAKIYSASMNEKEIGNVTYATIGSIVNIAHLFKEYGISKVIIDECDRFPREPNGMLRKFLRGADIKHVLGLTATPLKLQSNLGKDFGTISKLVMLTSRSKKGNFFKKIIHIEQIQNMVEKGYWTPIQYLSFDFNSGDLVYNTTGADYTNASIKRAYKKQNIHEKIKQKIEEFKHRKSILVAVPTIDHAEKLVSEVPNSATVHSKMNSKDRMEIVSKFKRGEIKVIIQVNVLSVGFDYPELDTIIIARPTASITWYYQFVGRVTRISENKTDALVVDLVGTVPKFGKVEDFYFKKEMNKWQLFGEGKKLLSGIPIREIGLHIEGEPSPYEKAENIEVIMPFGKYKGKPIFSIPKSYRDWMYKKFEWNRTNEHIKKEIERLNGIGI